MVGVLISSVSKMRIGLTTNADKFRNGKSTCPGKCLSNVPNAMGGDSRLAPAAFSAQHTPDTLYDKTWTATNNFKILFCNKHTC